MKKMKKLFAVILSLAMVLGMTMTALAKDQEADRIPRPADTVDVTITNIGKDATVTLYKIVKAEYADNGLGLSGYKAIAEVNLNDLVATPDNPGASSGTLTTIANNLVSGKWEPFGDPIQKVCTGTFTANVEAGAYIAIISGATDGKVYNPILLTAAYAPEANADASILAGQLVGGSVSTDDGYLGGVTAVAKSSTPDIDKAITDGTTPDVADPTKPTVSIGDVVTYTITPTMPQYPVEAVNKTFFVADTMTDGLTFDYSTLTITIDGVTVTRDGNTFKIGEKVIAEAAEQEKGFNLAFKYDNLVIDETTGAVYTPVISYKAVVNENANIGEVGNENDARMYFANQPNSGSSYENPNEEPDAQEDETITKKEDKEIVYTYRLAFRKNDPNTQEFLANAVFGIYDAAGTLVDVVTTNESGYAESTLVKSGTYTIKELVAPDGYALNEESYEIKAQWDTATTTVNGSVTTRQYTSQKDESLDGVQVGWLKDSKFYAMDEFKGTEGGVSPAYVKTEGTTTTSMTQTTQNPDGITVGGVALRGGDPIPNTTLSSLPSTGGIGTTIFTIGGCVIMIAAAALFFASRKKSQK